MSARSPKVQTSVCCVAQGLGTWQLRSWHGGQAFRVGGGRIRTAAHRILGNREVAQETVSYQTVPVVCLSCAFRSQICEGICLGTDRLTIERIPLFKVLVRRFLSAPWALCGSTARFGGSQICAAVHDELILLVKKEHVEKWRGLLKNAMESAEAKWLGDVPAIADVNVGETWQETH